MDLCSWKGTVKGMKRRKYLHIIYIIMVSCPRYVRNSQNSIIKKFIFKTGKSFEQITSPEKIIWVVDKQVKGCSTEVEGRCRFRP